MTLDSVLDWGLAVIGGGGIGSAITWLGTYKSRKKKEQEEAEQAEIATEDKHGMMERDRFEYMYQQITKMAKDYGELSDQFREYRKTARAIEDEFDAKIRERNNELAYMKDEIDYLKRLRCYNLDCPNRIKNKPENEE